jgi:hypothetical protein
MGTPIEVFLTSFAFATGLGSGVILCLFLVYFGDVALNKINGDK